MNERKRLVSEALDRLESWLHRRPRGAAASLGGDERSQSRWQRVFPILASVGLLGLFVYGVWFFKTTAQRMEADPLVVNLTHAPINAHVAFGNSPSCVPAPTDCWVRPDFDDSAWQSVGLPLDPSHNISSLPGYKVGLATDSVYYRFTIPIPDKLRGLREELSFTPYGVQHQSYAVYLNGRLVYTANGVGEGQASSISIPKQDILGGKVHVTIHATVEPADVGFASHQEMLLGPKAVIDTAYVHSERTFVTYYILFMLSKGSIFVIFALFFLYTKSQRGLFNFLIFAFFVTTENLYAGAFLPAYIELPAKVMLFFTSKAIAVVALSGFWLDFFYVSRHRTAYRAIGFALVGVVLAMTLDFGWGTHHVNFDALWGVTNAYLVASIVLAIGVGLLTIRMWKRVGADPERIRAFRGFVTFLAVYLAAIVYEFWFKTFVGFDQRAVFDLFFFYYLALVSAKDFGFKEGKIVSLEGHMAEKRRMEADLQEAAEIAKAFIPSTLPSWRSFTLDSFHRPLTEASGDWFAFESARERELHHFVMCDITGHGVQAAIVVSTCKAILSSLVRSSPDLLEREDFVVHYITNLNATLWTNGQGAHVSTILGLTLDAEAHRLYYLTAGHPPPVLLPRDHPAKPQVLLSRNQLLGIGPNYTAQMKSTPFTPGDQLIAYTDGVPVTANVRALSRFIQEHGGAQDLPRGQSQALYTAILEAERRRTQQTLSDDVSIVWFRAVA